MNKRISLCVIAGNEHGHILRFLDSFAAAFDELCLVRAIGNREPDDTYELADKWCARSGKAYHFAEYGNAGIAAKHGATPDDGDPSTWPHVDDFAMARNQAFALARTEWILWADLDDVLADGAADRIRASITNYGDKYDVFCYAYELPGQNQSNLRERLFRQGHWHWSQPVHENCNHPPGSRIANDTACTFIHNPTEVETKDPRRNERILKFHTRHAMPFMWELHREYYFRWINTKDEDARRQSIHYGRLALMYPALADEMRLSTLCTLAVIEPEVAMGRKWALDAIERWPNRREGFYRMAQRETEGGAFTRAIAWLEASSMFRKPPSSGYPIDAAPYGQPAFELLVRACRLAGDHKKADAYLQGREKKFGVKFSLLHATRGRPALCLDARAAWMISCQKPECVEHLFAVDADDEETIKATEGYERVIVNEPRGCVRAWNLAASLCRGEILIQVSDDWIPCLHWDHFIGYAMKDATGPAVLQVDDGHRKDDLLCMAILNRARYEQQTHLFSDEYFGVFSDNEFSLRAFKDGVVIDGRNIKMRHNHPIFSGKEWGEMDATYQRQNAAERYAEGHAIFNRRNAHLLK
jgi:hypothetical protein